MIPPGPSWRSLIRVADPILVHWFLAATPVVGQFDPLPESGGRTAGPMRIVIARREAMRPLGVRFRARGVLDADYAWHPLTAVENENIPVCPRELGPLLRGYLEGWIPDGVITLIDDPLLRSRADTGGSLPVATVPFPLPCPERLRCQAPITNDVLPPAAH